MALERARSATVILYMNSFDQIFFYLTEAEQRGICVASLGAS